MKKTLEIDFGDYPEIDFSTLDIGSHDEVRVAIPFSYLGSSNSYVDVCVDFLHASWAVERLASCAKGVSASLSNTGVTATLDGPLPSIREALADCAVLYSEDDPMGEAADRLDGVMNAIADFEHEIHLARPRAPELVDAYLVNLVVGANKEWQSESPDYYKDQIARFPERQLDFFRSAHSSTLGRPCYSSPDGWIVPRALNLDRFFRTTGQKYGQHEFLPAEIVVVDGQSMAVAEDVVADFSMRELVRSQACAGLVSVDPDDDHDGPYEWLNGPSAMAPGRGVDLSGPWGEEAPCRIHSSGTLAIIADREFLHLLYNVKPTSASALNGARARAAELADKLSRLANSPAELSLDWSVLSDEDFEQLCYDLIATHPKYDADTIRKLGKSRSRDGGRDIQVCDIPTSPWDKPRKWIFQCKLVTNGASLGAAKVVDVGDMLEQHGAEGFGVMTSAPIDATLYDKVDKVCERRGVLSHHWSVLEIERAVARNGTLKKRYFGRH